MIEVRPSTVDDAYALDLREGDEKEIAALGLGKIEAIERSLARSIEADTYLVDGAVAAVMGVALASFVGGTACPWMLTGRPVDRARKTFLRLTRERTAQLLARYGYLENWAHADYVEALRWARWLGFHTAAPAPYGPFDAPFVKLWMGERNAV